MYRKCAGVMLLNDKNQVFVGKRLGDSTNSWQMPQGGIDDGESPSDAARRELLEEIGTNNASLIFESDGWLQYDLPKEIAEKKWNGKYIGQTQKWFLMKFNGQDSDVNLNAHNPPEFIEWKWINYKDLPEFAIFFKKDVYKKLLVIFKDFL